MPPLQGFGADSPGHTVRCGSVDALTRSGRGDGRCLAIVIDNRAGAGGAEAAEAIARAAPDGYTVGALTPGVPVVRIVAGTKISIDPNKDLVPLTAVGTTPSLDVANISAPVNSFRADRLWRNPGNLCDWEIRLLTGAEMVHVPYKAGAQAMLDVVTGLIPIGYFILNEVEPQVKAGKIKVLATREGKRVRQFPDLPTVSELVPGFEPMPGWTGLFMPARVPQAVFKRLYSDTVKAIKLPKTIADINKLGFDVIANSPEEFAAQIKHEIALVTKIVKAANIRLE
jgi:tripartite-type tricarboxylate transporter receptor subunit TctC